MAIQITSPARPKINRAVRRTEPVIFVVTRARLATFQDELKRACGNGVDLSVIVDCSPGGSGQPTHYAIEMDFVEQYPGYAKLLNNARWAKNKVPGNAVTEHSARDPQGRKMSFDDVMIRDGRALKKHPRP